MVVRFLATAAGAALVVPALVAGPLPVGAAPPAGLTVSVTGADVHTFPAYDAGADRFAIRTGPDTDGNVEVTVAATDPDARVRIDGARVASGEEHAVTGLRPGDEVNVQVTTSRGESNQSWIYLPPGFPRLEATGTDPGNGPVFLGLGSVASVTGFETVVDARGVPLHVRKADEPHDFRAHDHGPDYTVFEPVRENDADTDHGYRVREYDRQFRWVGQQRLRPDAATGITPDDTDFHDLEYLPDGRLVLLGHHRDIRADGTPWLDAVLQIVGRGGEAEFTWSSKGHVDPGEGYAYGASGEDYAHLNSVEMESDGDLVASFRNTSQVLRIATVAHDGFAPGDVVWRLGGERNEFTFVGDPFGGFSAQHDARILANGHLLLFDNGAQHDQSRIVEYSLDTSTMTATQVWSFVPKGRYTPFGGSAQRLDDGSTLAGWSRSETTDESSAPIASRVSATGEEVWELHAQGWFSYRAQSAPAPDRIPPRIRVAFPRRYASYPEGTDLAPRFTCHDRGGSNLTDCRVVRTEGGARDQPGPHRVTFAADDGAGNSVTRRVTYVVRPLRQPDLQVRAADGHWLGRDRWPETDVTHRADSFERVGATRRYQARIVNAGFEGERYRLTARSGGAGWSVRYRRDGRDVTRALTSGRLSPRLIPGDAWPFTIVVRRTAGADGGTARLITARAHSVTDPTRRDRIAVRIRAR